MKGLSLASNTASKSEPVLDNEASTTTPSAAPPPRPAAKAKGKGRTWRNLFERVLLPLIIGGAVYLVWWGLERLRRVQQQELQANVALRVLQELPKSTVVACEVTPVPGVPDGQGNSRVVGVAGFSLHGTEAILRPLCIHPAVAGSGYGGVLLTDVFREARRAGATTLSVDTLLSVAPFYQRFGFTGEYGVYAIGGVPATGMRLRTQL